MTGDWEDRAETAGVVLVILFLTGAISGVGLGGPVWWLALMGAGILGVRLIWGRR